MNTESIPESTKRYVPDGPFGDAGALLFNNETLLPTIYVRGVGHLDLEGDEALLDGRGVATRKKGSWVVSEGFGGTEFSRMVRVLTAWSKANES